MQQVMARSTFFDRPKTMLGCWPYADADVSNNWSLMYRRQMTETEGNRAFNTCLFNMICNTVGRDDGCTIVWVQCYEQMNKKDVERWFKGAHWIGSTDPMEEDHAWNDGLDEDSRRTLGQFVWGKPSFRRAGRFRAESYAYKKAKKQDGNGPNICWYDDHSHPEWEEE